jgi:hypothetical protein
MCNMGANGCSESTSNTTINGQYTFCCRSKPDSPTHVTVLDSSAQQYMGCRCTETKLNPVYWWDYQVPDAGVYQSTGTHSLWVAPSVEMLCSG